MKKRVASAQYKKPHSARMWVAAWIGFFVVCFVASQILSGRLLWLLNAMGVVWSAGTTTGALWFRLLVYAVFVGLLVGIPYFLRHRLPSRTLLGITRPLEWRDIGLAVPGAIAYILLAIVILWLAQFIPGFNAAEVQNVGISNMLALDRTFMFLVFVVITPLAEEWLFRGFLYGRLRQYKTPVWASTLVVSALFGLAHMQWNVGLDVFCLSVVACLLREFSGSIWPGVVLHMLKNAVACYALLTTAQIAISLW